VLLVAAFAALPLAASLPRGSALAATEAPAVAAGAGAGAASEGAALPLELAQALSGGPAPSMAEVGAVSTLEEAAGALERLEGGAGARAEGL